MNGSKWSWRRKTYKKTINKKQQHEMLQATRQTFFKAHVLGPIIAIAYVGLPPPGMRLKSTIKLSVILGTLCLLVHLFSSPLNRSGHRFVLFITLINGKRSGIEPGFLVLDKQTNWHARSNMHSLNHPKCIHIYCHTYL